LGDENPHDISTYAIGGSKFNIRLKKPLGARVHASILWGLGEPLLLCSLERSCQQKGGFTCTQVRDSIRDVFSTISDVPTLAQRQTAHLSHLQNKVSIMRLCRKKGYSENSKSRRTQSRNYV
jgi:hypothetical protein